MKELTTEKKYWVMITETCIIFYIISCYLKMDLSMSVFLLSITWPWLHKSNIFQSLFHAIQRIGTVLTIKNSKNKLNELDKDNSIINIDTPAKINAEYCNYSTSTLVIAR